MTPAYRERVAPDSQVEFERLVGTAKHPLRIDIRHNDANPAVLEGTLESAMLNPNQYKGASGGGGGDDAGRMYIEDPNELAIGLWSPSGLIDTVRKQSSQKGVGGRPNSAMTRRAPAQLGDQQGQSSLQRPPIRPQSAIVGGRDRSQSPAMGVSVGARALMLHPGDEEKDGGSDMETPRSARRAATEEHGGLIAMIESSGPKAARLSKGANGTGGGGNDAVGSILDESIRIIQEQVPASEGKKSKKKKKTVNETILSDTKRVYVNKMHFPGEDEALAVIEARKRAAQAALSAGGGGPRERDEQTRKRPSTAGAAPPSHHSAAAGETKGGGTASALAASAVRNRLNAAKEQEGKLTGTVPPRPLSAAVSSSSSKKSSAHTLLGGIQKLNPASLF